MKNRRIFITLFFPLLLLAGCEKEVLLPQAPAAAHTYGGKGDEYTSGIVALPNNGGFLLVGGQKADDRNDFDLLLIRTDPEGNEIWSKTYGYPDADELGWKVLRKPNGEYFIFGTRIYAETSETWFQVTMLDQDFNLIRQQNTVSEFGTSLYAQNRSKLYHLADGNTLAIYNENGLVGTVIFEPDGQVKAQSVLEGKYFQRSGSFVTELQGGGYVMAFRHLSYRPDSIQLHLLDQFGAYDRTAYITTNQQNIFPFTMSAFSNGTYHLEAYSGETSSIVRIHVDSNFQVLLETETNDQTAYKFLLESQSGNLVCAGEETFADIESFGKSNILFRTMDQVHQTVKESVFEGASSNRLLELILLADGRFAAIGQTNSYGAGGYDALFFFVEE